MLEIHLDVWTSLSLFSFKYNIFDWRDISSSHQVTNYKLKIKDFIDKYALSNHQGVKFLFGRVGCNSRIFVRCDLRILLISMLGWVQLLLNVCGFLKSSSEPLLFLLENRGLFPNNLVMLYPRVFCYTWSCNFSLFGKQLRFSYPLLQWPLCLLVLELFIHTRD